MFVLIFGLFMLVFFCCLGFWNKHLNEGVDGGDPEMYEKEKTHE